MKNVKQALLLILVLLVALESTGSPAGETLRDLMIAWGILWLVTRYVKNRRRGTRELREFDRKQAARAATSSSWTEAAPAVAAEAAYEDGYEDAYLDQDLEDLREQHAH